MPTGRRVLRCPPADAGVVRQDIERGDAGERRPHGRFIGNIKYEHGSAGQFPRQGFGAGDRGFAPVHAKGKMHRLNSNALRVLQDEVVECSRCPRLIAHCAEVARVKRRAYRDWEYWGRPVPSFGDRRAELLIVGLAPGAHGSNRTGRMFTGDVGQRVVSCAAPNRIRQPAGERFAGKRIRPRFRRARRK